MSKKAAKIYWLMIVILPLLISSSYICKEGISSVSGESIIGVWKYHKHFEDGVEIELDFCEMEDTFTFKENGTFTEVYYYIGENLSCKIDGENSGTWMKNNQDSYTMMYDGDTFKIKVDGDKFYINYVEDIIKQEIYIRQSTLSR